MAIYTIEANGQQFDIEGPDNASDADLQSAVSSYLSPQTTEAPAAPTQEPSVMDKIKSGISLAGEVTEAASPVGVLNAVDRGLDVAGDRTEKYLTEKGHPTAGKVVGGAISHIPEIAGAVELVPGLMRGGASLAKAGMSKLGQVANTLKGPSAEEAKILANDMMLKNAPKATEKAQAYLSSQEQRINQLLSKVKDKAAKVTLNTARKEEILNKMLGEVGEKMGKAEELMGIRTPDLAKIKAATKDPKAIADLSSTMVKWSKMTGKELAEKGIAPAEIQYVRKFAESMKNSPELLKIENAIVQRGREVAAQAIEEISPAFKAARTEYKEVLNTLDDLPSDALRQKTLYKTQVIKAQNAMKNLKAEASELLAKTKSADREELIKLKQEANKLRLEGVKHDKLVEKIKNTLWGGSIVGGAYALGKKAFQ